MERAELDAIVREIIDRSELGILIRQLQGALKGLRVVAGAVTSGGAVSRGEGFSASRSSAGVYVVTFTDAFSAAPYPVVTVENTGALAGRTDSGVTASGFTARTFTVAAAPAATDAAFAFVAIGPA